MSAGTGQFRRKSRRTTHQTVAAGQSAAAGSSDVRPLRIAHLSDLHIARAPLAGDLNLKRILGRANYLLFRQHRYKERIAAAAVAKMAEKAPDLALLTGDTTQLGLDAEFDAAEALLSPLAAAGIPVIAVAGNHDIYGRSSRLRYEAFRSRLARGLERDAHGIIRLPGAEILALEQDGESLPFLSRGTQRLDELERAAEAWRSEPNGTVRLVCGHYPVIDPHGGRLAFMHGLRQVEVLMEFCRAHRVTAYFCGHNHRRFSAPMPGGCMQIAASALSDIRRKNRRWPAVYECRPGNVSEA